MILTMASPKDDSYPTRSSLLIRLKDTQDQRSWQEFNDIYGRLIFGFARKAGLTETEAEEVVQETMISAAKHLPEFRYDPKVCSFKTWLLNLTSWRIKDQLKKRKPAGAQHLTGSGEAPAPLSDDTTRTATINRVPDPHVIDLDTQFEQEWRRNLLAAALDRVKGKFSLKHYQIFDLLVVKEWPAADVARSLGVSFANVYVTKHRVAAAVKKEVKRLEKEFEDGVQRQTHSGPATK